MVSLLVYDEDDDPLMPTVTVSYNTETQVRTFDEDEARWNYAFWLHEELALVADSAEDPDGAELRDAWIADGARAEQVTEDFVDLVVRVVQRLHEEGVIERVFERPIPVLVHELEYYEEIAEQNERANPAGLVADFTDWVRGLSSA